MYVYYCRSGDDTGWCSVINVHVFEKKVSQTDILHPLGSLRVLQLF